MNSDLYLKIYKQIKNYNFLQINKMSQDAIKVVCRLRSFNKIQSANNGQQCVEFDMKNIKINVGGQDVKYNFAFDRIFGPTAQQIDIYKQVAIPVIKSVITGFNGTIFAYGQTGAGKTWTMQGPNHYDLQFKGLIPRTIQGLFLEIRQSDQNVEYVIRCSYVEIYNEKIFDLLDPSKSRLQVKQDKHKGVFIQNCTEISVGSPQQMLKVMNNGSQNRKVAFTGMNERSSRSHSLFIIHVSQKHLQKDSTKQSRLYFVDLAGSQKISKTGVQGQQLQQAKNINKSLSALGNVINALTSEKKEHVPYRDSKLTRILQESLGGNSRTTLVICCSMCTYNDKQTLGTLRFGYRAKSIKNKVKCNQQKSAKELMILLEAANKTIYDLKIQLKAGVISNVNLNIQNDEFSTQIPSETLQQLQNQATVIFDLKKQLQLYVSQQQQRSKQLKQYQLRMKSILLQLNNQRQNNNIHLQQCSTTYKCFKDHLSTINKFIKRAIIDVQYFINSDIINAKTNSQQNLQDQKVNHDLNNNLTNFIKQANHYMLFYDQKLKTIFQNLEREAHLKDLDNFQIHSDKGNWDQIKDKFPQDQSFKSQGQNQRRKMKIALSQPQLFPIFKDEKDKIDQFQMSYIYQRGPQQSLTITSDKISQQQSFTQIQTLLQSLQTKQSHKILLEQLNYNLKVHKRENQQLTLKIQKLKTENRTIQEQIQNKYLQSIADLQQRVEQYKNIINKKDQQIQQYNLSKDKIKKQLMQEKVVADRFKKIIQANSSMKQYYQMQQRVRTLGSQRQKLFNQMYQLRQQLDQADVTLRQKDQHIQSLKQVMKQLSTNMTETKTNQSNPKWQSPRDIQKRYNVQMYGTQNLNVVQPIRGGDTQKKKSSLRSKISLQVRKDKEQKSGIGSYIKGFFG